MAGVEWSVVAELGTAAGTLVLAAATFASVRSGNRSARAAERSLLAGIRPLLLPSRPHDEAQDVVFADRFRVTLPGGQAVAEATDDAVYFALSLRNVGTGLGVVRRWRFTDHRLVGESGPPPLSEFAMLTRDMYVATTDVGFFQGAIRDDDDPRRGPAATVIRERGEFTIDLYYSDSDGGQHTISRFTVSPLDDSDDPGDGWRADVSHHWNLDRAEPT